MSETTYALTALDIAALRKCDDIVCQHGKEKGSTVRAIKRREKTEKDPFADDVCHVIPCQHRLVDYALKSGSHVADGSFRGFDMFHGAGRRDDSDWSGPLAFLRPGDVLRLAWGRDAGSTQALEKDSNGFHADRLSLVVERGSKRFTFLVGTSICQDNSARMIRY